jgi:hypothetical protein
MDTQCIWIRIILVHYIANIGYLLLILYWNSIDSRYFDIKDEKMVVKYRILSLLAYVPIEKKHKGSIH